jgi:hypothetical protein
MNGATIALIAAAAGISGSYGNSLLDALHVRHPELSGVQIVAATRDGAQITIERRWRGRSRTSVTHALSDANGNEIGIVSFKSSCSRAPSSSDLEGELSRRINTTTSLSEPDPFVTGATRAPAAQLMIDDALSEDPTIITLAFHVTPPGRTVNSIVASSFGRIGKPGDLDDESVIRGETHREITNNGKRIAIELPLLDARRRTIGALSTSFRFEPGKDQNQMEAKAVALRDAFARHTSSLKALFRPATASRQVWALRTCR